MLAGCNGTRMASEPGPQHRPAPTFPGLLLSWGRRVARGQLRFAPATSIHRNCFDPSLHIGIRFGTLMPRTRLLPSSSLRSLRVHCGAALLVASLLQPAAAHADWAALAHHENQARRDVMNVEQEWRRAQLTNDLRTMERLLADDYIGISANGTIQTKAELLSMHRSRTLRIMQLEINGTRIRVFGDTAVVTSRAELQGVNGPQDMTGRYRYTRVYNRRGGQWKIVSFEASRIHDADARSR